MPIHHAIILGIVQGLTEFLPISSTAHLFLVPYFLGWPRDPGLTFTVALHVGTFLAVLGYFRHDLARLIASGGRLLSRPAPRRDPDQRMALMLVLGTIPAVIAGVTLEDEIEGRFRSPAVIGWALVIVALVIAAVDRRAGRGRARDLGALGYLDALVIGIAQACALVPGVSRSGATIAMGLGIGLSRDAAARFSFLLGVPAIFGACVFKLRDLLERGGSVEWAAFGAGIAASAIVGYLSIHWLLAYVRKQSFGVFVVYRLIVGGVVLAVAYR